MAFLVTTCLFAESKGLGNPAAVDEGWGAPSMKSQNRYTPSKTNMEPSKNDGLEMFFHFQEVFLLGSRFGPSTGSTGERSITWKLNSIDSVWIRDGKDLLFCLDH